MNLKEVTLKSQTIGVIASNDTIIINVDHLTFDSQKNITNGSGNFIRKSDNTYLGSFSIGEKDNTTYSMRVDSATCECVMALAQFKEAVIAEIYPTSSLQEGGEA